MKSINCTNIEFDSLIGKQGQIDSIDEMEAFLIRAAHRYHTLNSELNKALDDDKTLSPVQMSALNQLSDWFGCSMSDNRMFFSETEGFWELPKEERNRLNGLADILVLSSRDFGKVEAAQALSKYEMDFESQTVRPKVLGQSNEVVAQQ